MARKTRSQASKANASRDAAQDDINTVFVLASSDLNLTRGGGALALDTGKLSENVKDFLEKMRRILGDAPSVIGNYELSEFEVTAEISTEGTLGILGMGVKAAGKGGLTFKFTRARAS